MKIGPDNILQRHVKNGSSDSGLHERTKPGATGREVKVRSKQRHGMPHRENRNHGNQAANIPERNDPAQKKEQMIDAAQYVCEICKLHGLLPPLFLRIKIRAVIAARAATLPPLAATRQSGKTCSLRNSVYICSHFMTKQMCGLTPAMRRH